MELLKFLAVLILCSGFVFLLWAFKGWLLKPIIGGRNTCLTVVVSVKGSAPELEQTVSGLMWLKKNGTLNADILIVDEGLDADAALTARLLSTEDYAVQVCSPDQIENFIIWSCDNGGDY